MKTAIVQNGLFEVNEIGEVFRIKNGVKTLASQSKTGRNKRYCVVTARVDGVQRHYYVHRLVAEAFIPKPEGASEVNHKDGNPSNNRVENLEWCSRSENAEHAFRTGLINPYRNAAPCQNCGEYTCAKDHICPACKAELRGLAKRDDRSAQARDALAQIPPWAMTKRTSQCVEMRKAGLSLEEVGLICGVSRQCVDQAIKMAFAKAAKGAHAGNQVRIEVGRLERKIAKRKTKIQEIDKEKSRITEEINDLEKSIARLLQSADQAS